MGTLAGDFVIGDELRHLNGMKYCLGNMKCPVDMKLLRNEEKFAAGKSH